MQKAIRLRNTKKNVDFEVSMRPGAIGLKRKVGKTATSIADSAINAEKPRVEQSEALEFKDLEMIHVNNIVSYPQSHEHLTTLLNKLRLGDPPTEVEDAAISNAPLTATFLGTIQGKVRKLVFEAEPDWITIPMPTCALTIARNRYYQTAFVRLVPKDTTLNVIEYLIIFNSQPRLSAKTTEFFIPPDSNWTTLKGTWNDFDPTLSVNRFETTPKTVGPYQQAPETAHKTLFELNRKYPPVRFVPRLASNNPKDPEAPYLNHLAQCLREMQHLDCIAATLRAVVAALVPRGKLAWHDTVNAIKFGLHRTQAREEIALLADAANTLFNYTDNKSPLDKLSPDIENNFGHRLVMYLLQKPQPSQTEIIRASRDATRYRWDVHGQRACLNALIRTSTNYYLDLSAILGAEFKLADDWNLRLAVQNIPAHVSNQAVLVSSKRTQQVRLTLDIFHEHIQGVSVRNPPLKIL